MLFVLDDLCRLYYEGKEQKEIWVIAAGGGDKDQAMRCIHEIAAEHRMPLDVLSDILNAAQMENEEWMDDPSDNELVHREGYKHLLRRRHKKYGNLSDRQPNIAQFAKSKNMWCGRVGRSD